MTIRWVIRQGGRIGGLLTLACLVSTMLPMVIHVSGWDATRLANHRSRKRSHPVAVGLVGCRMDSWTDRGAADWFATAFL